MEELIQSLTNYFIHHPAEQSIWIGLPGYNVSLSREDLDGIEITIKKVIKVDLTDTGK